MNRSLVLEGQQTMTTNATGTRDVTCDVVSVLYRTLQEAEMLQRYIDDARSGGEEEAATFSTEVQQQDRDRAERAKELLRSRLNR